MTERESDLVTILDLRGRLTFGAACEELRSRALAMLQQGRNRLVLNFADAPFIDSSGLGTLVSLNAAYQAAEGGLRLLNLSSKHLELFLLTKLNTEFQIFHDEQAAIDTFFPERAPVRFDILEFVREQEGERTEDQTGNDPLSPSLPE